MTDHDLLQAYARENSQAAFAELVARHVNLVYSAARRQVRQPQLAEEITQSVFLDLTRRAGELPCAQPLAAWLHVVTRRTAIDVIRRESRRQAREQTAVALAAMSPPPLPPRGRRRENLESAQRLRARPRRFQPAPHSRSRRETSPSRARPLALIAGQGLSSLGRLPALNPDQSET